MTSPEPRAHFGRKKGHRLRAAQAERLERLLPRLALPVDQPAPHPLAALFGSEIRAVRLEIGFGGGEHMLHRARTEPEIGFIGCEAFQDGVAKTLAGIERDGLGNVRLHFGDALEVLGWLPEASLERIYLLYPDPWPKRRHWKRRFINDERLAALARVLAAGGHIHFASDISSNISWTLAHVGRSADFCWRAGRASDWQTPWSGWPTTRYERKALREGRRPAYLTLERRSRLTSRQAAP